MFHVYVHFALFPRRGKLAEDAQRPEISLKCVLYEFAIVVYVTCRMAKWATCPGSSAYVDAKKGINEVQHMALLEPEPRGSLTRNFTPQQP